MAGTCARRSPLARSGLTQAGRRRSELAGDYFHLDERDIPDLILFGRRYAQHIRYYNSANAADGDWTRFFESDVSANLAALARLPADTFATFHRDLETWLKANPGRDPAALAAYFKLVFHLPLELLQSAGEIVEKLPPLHPINRQVGELVKRDLAEPLGSLIAWYKGAIEPAAGIFADEPISPADYKIAADDADTKLRLSSTIQVALLKRKTPANEPLSIVFVEAMGAESWPKLWNFTAADSAPYGDDSQPLYEKIYDALEHNLFEAGVRNLYGAATRLKREAVAHLRDSLEQLAGHEPHYALWLAFLQLFRHAQDELNAFTGRHLDFYFSDVLRLRPRNPIPDRVHLLFELAKRAEPHLLTAGTAFRAGKDALGRPVSYVLEQDLVVNHGRLAAIHAVRIDSGVDGAIARASTEPRSLDGVGKEKLPAEQPLWPVFGPDLAPTARIGFAIADRKLFMREGSRTIMLTAELGEKLNFVPANDAWQVRLTGPEGWFEPGGGLTMDPALQSLKFLLTIPADAPAIVPFDPKLHGSGTGEAGPPRIEILFNFAKPSGRRAFEGLRKLRIHRLALAVEASRLKQLSLVAGGAATDPAKPFAAFGAQPAVGTSLIVGSSEIFSKPIATLTLTFDWQQNYTSAGFFYDEPPAHYKVTPKVLKDGGWLPTGTDQALFGASTSVQIAVAGSAFDRDRPQLAENPSLTAESVGGFLRLDLNDDFGHASYPLENARALVQLANEKIYYPPNGVNSSGVVQKTYGGFQRKYRDYIMAAWNEEEPQPGGLPLKPYDPIVTQIRAAYVSTDGPVERFIHVHPFGEAVAQTHDRLFPSLPFAGALFIGIAAFDPPARLTLLVQVADGTGDPLREPPDLQFDYLSGDSWIRFEDRDVDDKTDNLAASGLISLAVPTEADLHHGLMPGGLRWIRISAPSDADAFNALLSIDGQAGIAAFRDAGNDPRFLATPLPAESISKLAVADPSIKKVRQPYGSFGGRPAEAPDAFTTRVSERLRHKDRAVTPFDYEALILEAFPQLFRAKCIPTSALIRDADGWIAADNEAAPGGVTVVTVPQTHGLAARNPLRPYADHGLLSGIRAFLGARISPFVSLEVQNPKFEEVQAAFKVRFHPDIADIAFYKEALNDALVAYLTPWASPAGGEIMFGGRLWKSSLIDFVEERPEVDFVTDFHLYHKPDADAGPGSWTPVDLELVEATTARSILVSAKSHQIFEVGVDA